MENQQQSFSSLYQLGIPVLEGDSLEDLNGVQYPIVGFVKGTPFLHEINPSFKGYYTLLIEGGNVEELLKTLEEQFFYTHKYKKCI